MVNRIERKGNLKVILLHFIRFNRIILRFQIFLETLPKKGQKMAKNQNIKNPPYEALDIIGLVI